VSQSVQQSASKFSSLHNHNWQLIATKNTAQFNNTHSLLQLATSSTVYTTATSHLTVTTTFSAGNTVKTWPSKILEKMMESDKLQQSMLNHVLLHFTNMNEYRLNSQYSYHTISWLCRILAFFGILSFSVLSDLKLATILTFHLFSRATV